MARIADPREYFRRFDPAQQRDADELIDWLLAEFPELELTVKYNAPFFRLRSNGWSVFQLTANGQGLKVGFVNDAAEAFHNAHRDERLRGSEHLQTIHVDPASQADRRLIRTLVADAIAIQAERVR